MTAETVESISVRNPPLELYYEEGTSTYDQAYNLWHHNLSHYMCASELRDYVADALHIDSAVINGWISLYSWSRPEDRDANNPDDVDDSLFSLASSHDLFQVYGIDRRMTAQELREMAVDPLSDFWSRMRTDYRRPARTWLHGAGYVPLAQIDMAHTQLLLDQFPLTCTQLASILCVEPDIFANYANAKGVKARKDAGSGRIHVGQLACRHPLLAQTLAQHCQYLYRHYAIPILRLSQLCDISWQDLWSLGVQHGNGWILPTANRLSEVERIISSYEI